MSLHMDDGDLRLHVGDALEVLRTLPAGSVDSCVTSPPYWGLRDYGADGQIGLEATPAAFVERLTAVFEEVRRVLAPHGTLWLNLGDSYAANISGGLGGSTLTKGGTQTPHNRVQRNGRQFGVKPKDLVGIPWRVAFALQDAGWWLRSDIIWAKPNPMPESVTDRPTKAHEYLFLLAAGPRYYYDADAIREADVGGDNSRSVLTQPEPSGGIMPPHLGIRAAAGRVGAGRNARSVWSIPTQPYPEAHFATFPEELPRRCILAGTPERVCRTCGEPSRRVTEQRPTGQTQRQAAGWDTGPGAHGTIHSEGRRPAMDGPVPVVDVMERVTTGWTDCGHDDWRPGVVLEPFAGSGTTLAVARQCGRNAVGIELNPEYADLIARRTRQLSLLGGLA